MVVCKFFLQGNCRFGANCRNEHPSGQGGGGGGGGFGNQNRFGALSNTNSNATTNRFGGTNDTSKPYTINVSEVQLDLTRGKGRPNWVLSTYGAARGTPASLFEGNEYSPEEVRARFYEMASKGQEAQADQEAIQLWTKAEQDLDNAANHIDDVAKFMDEAAKKHPNRYDFLNADGSKTREELVKEAEASNNTTSGFGASGFGQPANNSNPFSKPPAATFGQPSQPSAFGASTFGKPAQPSGFGQAALGQSAFGSPTSAFGQPGAQQSSAFGQPSGASAFGQPAASSAFGKPAFGASAFGQSAFGQTAQPSSPSTFNQPAQASNPSPFGQPSSTPAFGASAFGQSAKPNPFAAPSAGSGFGASASAFGQPAQSTPAFGQSSQPASAFGQPSQPTSAFGQPSQPASAFGQPSQSGSGFGQSAFGQPAQPSGFGQSAFGQSAQPSNSSPFGQSTNTPSAFGASTADTPAFGQTMQQNASPFGNAAESNTTEVSMDADPSSTASPTMTRPFNPFGAPPPSAPAAPAAQAQPAAPTLGTATASAPPQPNLNTSQTPNSLTSKPPQALHYTQTLPSVPPQTDVSRKLTTYRGQRVQYADASEGGSRIPCYNRPDGKGLEKIWYPEAGATQEVVFLNKEDKLLELQAGSDKYTDAVKQQYAYLFDEGRFKDGKIPLVPPMREWCVYDF